LQYTVLTARDSSYLAVAMIARVLRRRQLANAAADAYCSVAYEQVFFSLYFHKMIVRFLARFAVLAIYIEFVQTTSIN
jgi:hypothetical protein